MTQKFVVVKRETQESVSEKIVGKTVQSVEYNNMYCDITINFTDGTILEVSGEDCFDFSVYVSK